VRRIDQRPLHEVTALSFQPPILAAIASQVLTISINQASGTASNRRDLHSDECSASSR
jgi:hypothetical protein